MSFWRAMTSLRRCAIPQDWYMVPAISIPENIRIPECSCAHSAISLMLVEASTRVRVLVMQKRAACSSCQEETLLINNEYMTIGQAKAKPYWFALCLTDVFIFLQLDTPLFVALISEGRL